MSAETYPQTFATALFSFLYHLATYEASEFNGCVYLLLCSVVNGVVILPLFYHHNIHIGGDALVSSGIMESLLQVVDWQSPDPSCITFVTRAVRVIDLITNLDMTAFHSLGGWNKLLWRLKVSIHYTKYTALCYNECLCV